MKQLILFFALIYQAETNYQNAIYNTKLSAFTDSEIEYSMKQYGFEIDANDTTKISLGEKIVALRNKPKFANH